MPFILVLLLAAAVAWFTVQNQQPIAIHLYGAYTVGTQLIWLILGSATVGAVITYAWMVARSPGRKESSGYERRLEEQERKVKEMEAKLMALEEAVRKSQEQRSKEWQTPTGS